MFCEASTRESDSDLIDGSEANKQFGKMVNVPFLVCCCSDVRASSAYAHALTMSGEGERVAAVTLNS